MNSQIIQTDRSTTHPIYILGAGSQGLLFASHMQRKNIPVTLLAKNANKKQLLEQGLKSDQQILKIPCQIPSELADKTIHRLLICLKTWQTLDAVQPLLDKLADHAEVLLVQNGMGIIEQLQQRLNQQQRGLRVFHGLSTHGAWHQQCDGQIQLYQAGLGELRIDANIASDWQQTLQQAQLNPQPDQHIEQAAWNKLLVNCCINALTAVAQVNNGQLASDPWLKQITQQLINECIDISEKRFADFDSQACQQLIWQVIDKTAANKSSTYQDRHANRPSEIDAINGYLLQIARQLKTELPVINSLYCLLKHSETGICR